MNCSVLVTTAATNYEATGNNTSNPPWAATSAS